MKIVVLADITGERVAVIVPEKDLFQLQLMAARTGMAILKIEDEQDAIDGVTAARASAHPTART